MNRKLKATLFAVAFIGIVAAAFAFYWIGSTQRIYQGKSVKQWFREIDAAHAGEDDPRPIVALVAMADQAAPYVLKQYRMAYSTRSRRSVEQILRRWEPTDHFRAYYALKLMGPAAQEAVPGLLELAENAPAEHRYSAVELLGYIHSQPQRVVPKLVEFSHQTHWQIRRAALWALAMYGKDVASAAANLRPMLTDPDDEIVMHAATALVAAEQSLDLALPAIKGVLSREAHPQYLGLLEELGQKARPTFPVLTNLLTSEEVYAKKNLTNALKSIDAEAAAKVGIN